MRGACGHGTEPVGIAGQITRRPAVRSCRLPKAAPQRAAVGQDDITQLNQEGARLVADLPHAQAALYEQQTQGRQLAKQIITLQDAAWSASIHFAGQEAQAGVLQVQMAAAAEVAFDRGRELELAPGGHGAGHPGVTTGSRQRTACTPGHPGTHDAWHSRSPGRRA